jgi:hypothetical protein
MAYRAYAVFGLAGRTTAGAGSPADVSAAFCPWQSARTGTRTQENENSVPCLLRRFAAAAAGVRSNVSTLRSRGARRLGPPTQIISLRKRCRTIRSAHEMTRPTARTDRAARGVPPACNRRKAPAWQCRRPAGALRSSVSGRRPRDRPSRAARVSRPLQDDDADRPDDGNPGDEPDNEENDSEDHQGGLLDDGAAVPGRREDIVGVNELSCGACYGGGAAVVLTVAGKGSIAGGSLVSI